MTDEHNVTANWIIILSVRQHAKIVKLQGQSKYSVESATFEFFKEWSGIRYKIIYFIIKIELTENINICI